MQTTASSTFRKTTETFVSGAKTLPQQYFVSPEIFAEEQEKIFSAQWVLVGHQNQIAKPGDYFVAEVAGESLIIARDQDDRPFVDFTMFAATAERDSRKIEQVRQNAGTRRRFNVRITHGLTASTGD